VSEKLTAAEIDWLARYNAECARGIVHTDEWRARMADFQRRFGEEVRAGLVEQGLTEVDDGIWMTTTMPKHWWDRFTGLGKKDQP
jgi:hypothetical protein